MKNLFPFLLISFCLVTALGVYAVSQEYLDVSGRPALVPDEILLTYAPSVPVIQKKLLENKYGLLKKAESYKAGDFIVFKHKDPKAILEQLKKEPGVSHVEQNAYAYMAVSPVNDQYCFYQWNMVKINMPASWEINKGSGAVVAVIDTGIKQTLPDFAGTRFAAGYDFVNLDKDPTDDNGHGSH
ncbi:MAG: S8 family serine peptidase, partial [Acidobacteria bacterium]|nr:S8 family serine peptidase [Acidobacteriota bacterium]